MSSTATFPLPAKNADGRIASIAQPVIERTWSTTWCLFGQG
jgi:hypothetical protein